MNDLVDDVGDVTGLPDGLHGAVRQLGGGGRPPLELEAVAPVDGVVPASKISKIILK